MCAPSRLQQHIRNLTKDGEIVARFLVDTVQGKTPGVKACHQMEAMKYLDRYGFSDDANQEESHFWGLIPTPEELAASKDADQSPLSPRVRGNENPPHPVSHLDILNYEIAHLIRTETGEGHTIVEFLANTMTGRDKPYTPKKLRIKPADRMAASREIIRRGFGHFGRKRKLVVDDYDALHTDLAKRMREYSEHGTDAIRFLLDVMSHEDPDEPYTWHHRVSAAQELIRRGWDTNYDRITPEMLQAYWRNQQSPRLSVGQKKHLSGLPTTPDDYNQYDQEDYQAIADAIREQEDLEAAEGSKSLPPRRGKVRTGVKSPESNLLANPAERADGNPAGQGEETQNSKLETDNSPDCYHEPLNPDKQAIFDYQTLIESGEYEEGEITIRQPTPEDWKAYKYALAHITEIAAAEGVPLLPNPLADTLRHPNIRSP